jgi:hypothetical protein
MKSVIAIAYFSAVMAITGIPKYNSETQTNNKTRIFNLHSRMGNGKILRFVIKSRNFAQMLRVDL